MKNLKKILVLFTLVITCIGVYSCEYKRMRRGNAEYYYKYSEEYRLDAIAIETQKKLDNMPMNGYNIHMRNVQMENARREISRRAFIKK